MERKDPEVERAKQKAQKRQEKILILESGLGTIERIFGRGTGVSDPAIRYTLFLDRIYMALDFALALSEGVLKSKLDEFDVPAEYAQRIRDLSEKIQGEMKGVMEIVQKSTSQAKVDEQ